MPSWSAIGKASRVGGQIMPCTCRCGSGFLTTSSALLYRRMQVLGSIWWVSELSMDGGGHLGHLISLARALAVRQLRDKLLGGQGCEEGGGLWTRLCNCGRWISRRKGVGLISEGRIGG